MKRLSSQSGYFYRSVSATEQDNDDQRNLVLHLDQQLKNPTARVHGVRYLDEYLGDVRCIRYPRSMGRLQALFRDTARRDCSSKSTRTIKIILSILSNENVNDYLRPSS